jgi:hypothetical protein
MRQGKLMQITDDVNIPDEVIDALSAGKLVFFTGAGISMDEPSHLPTFRQLSKQLFELAGIAYPTDDVDPETLLGSLPVDFDVQKQTRSLFATSKSKPNRTHKILTRLAFSVADHNQPRIITTNYDELLEQAASDAHSAFPHCYVGPALPSGESFRGIVHLHGTVSDTDTPLVLTDRDFAKAYLTKAWATRFLLEMFQQYVVVFVGYSHDDLMMRYLAMGLPSNTRRYVFTDAENASHKAEVWQNLGIKTIPYPLHNGEHSALVNALETWARQLGEGRLMRSGRIADIVSQGVKNLSSIDADYLSRRISTHQGAIAFTEAARSSEEWLSWLLHLDTFSELLTSTNHDPMHENVRILLSWFYTQFAENPEKIDSVLQIIQSRRISDSVYRNLCIATRTLSEHNHIREASKLASLLATSIPGQSMPVFEDSLLYTASDQRVPLAVLVHALTPFVQSGKVSWNASGDEIFRQLGMWIETDTGKYR